MANDQATLEALLPQLLQLIRGQQYDYLLKNPNAASLFGMSAPQNSVPLNDAVVKMAYGLLPGWAQQGAQQGLATAPGSPDTGGRAAETNPDLGSGRPGGGGRMGGGMPGQSGPLMPDTQWPGSAGGSPSGGFRQPPLVDPWGGSYNANPNQGGRSGWDFAPWWLRAIKNAITDGGGKE